MSRPSTNNYVENSSSSTFSFVVTPNLTVNLAAALMSQGYSVGVMDADIYGPSIPIMLGVNERPQVLPDEYLMPIDVHNMKAMSVGFLVDEGKALDWRGNLASGTILQFIHKTFWGKLDFLIVDLPPGTGDVPLTIAHKIKSDGIIIVTTPQEVVLGDVRRGIDLFRSRKIPILGIIENMSHFICEHCAHENRPFAASQHGLDTDSFEGIDVLSKIPLSRKISEAADSGHPYVLSQDKNEHQGQFHELAKRIANKLGVQQPLQQSRIDEPEAI